MSRSRHHVIFNLEGGWSVTADGEVRAKRRFSSRDDAVHFARALAEARHGDLYLHQTDGSVAEKVSF